MKDNKNHDTPLADISSQNVINILKIIYIKQTI